jgi:hypothetical protein
VPEQQQNDDDWDGNAEEPEKNWHFLNLRPILVPAYKAIPRETLNSRPSHEAVMPWKSTRMSAASVE